MRFFVGKFFGSYDTVPLTEIVMFIFFLNLANLLNCEASLQISGRSKAFPQVKLQFHTLFKA